MNWEALGAIGELVGAIAVLITLVYLSLQIRENSKAQTLSTYNSFIDGYMRLNEWFTETPERTELALIIVGESDRELSGTETFQLNFMIRAYANHLLRMLRLYEAGTIQEKDWQNFAGEARQVFNSSQRMKEFQSNNQAFSDLWTHLETIQENSVSNFAI